MSIWRDVHPIFSFGGEALRNKFVLCSHIVFLNLQTGSKKDERNSFCSFFVNKESLTAYLQQKNTSISIRVSRSSL